MKGIVKREDLVLAIAQVILVAMAARQLDSSFNGFGAAVAEEGFLQSRKLDQFLGQ